MPKYLWSLALLAALAAFPLPAEEPSAAASIGGRVTTDGAAAFPGVTISLDSLTRTAHFETRSNATGDYRFENLAPGSYTILADAKTFGCVVIPKVVLEAGKYVRQDFQFVRAGRKLGCEASTLEGSGSLIKRSRTE